MLGVKADFQSGVFNFDGEATLFIYIWITYGVGRLILYTLQNLLQKISYKDKMRNQINFIAQWLSSETLLSTMTGIILNLCFNLWHMWTKLDYLGLCPWLFHRQLVCADSNFETAVTSESLLLASYSVPCIQTSQQTRAYFLCSLHSTAERMFED